MSNLQVKEIKGISIKNVVNLAICHDEFYLYSDKYSNIYTFDSNSLSNTILPFPDKKIKGNITSIDFSPSRKYAAAGYSDGAIQVFDLESNKPYKLLSKPSGNPIQSILFYSDTILLAVNAINNFFAYKIGFIIRDTCIQNFTSKPIKLYRPDIYRFVGGAERNSNAVLPNFIDCFALSTEKSFQFSLLAKDFVSSKVKLDIPTGNLIPCFYTLDSRNVLMAVAYTDKVEIYSISYTESLQITKKSTISTQFSLVFLSFLSPMILFGHDKDNQHFLMLSLDTNSSVEINSPINGFSIQGDSSTGPSILKDNKLYCLNLQTFASTIELYVDSVDQAETAIEFCKKAISNDPLATIGLPNNQYQKQLVIERSIGPILSNYLSAEIEKNSGDASQIADKFVKISTELKLQDWLINQGLPIFETSGQIKPVIEKIIESDPCATLFTYNRQFVESIINNFDIKDDENNKNGVSISNFLLSLPSRILSPVEIIKYAERTGSIFLLAQVYAIRLNDLTSALQVLANEDMFSNACMIIIHNQERIDISMQWSFTFRKGKFPYLEKICQCKEAKDVFNLFERRIEEKKSLINISDYVNAMIQTLYSIQKDQISSENAEFIDTYLSHMEYLMTTKHVRLLASSLKCVVSLIFAKNLPDTDPNKKRLEKNLIYVLSSDVPVKFKESLLRLCEPFGYKEAKRRIEEGAQKYESIIKESLMSSSKDVFKVTEDMLNKAKSNQNELILANTSIKNSLLTFAPYFIVKDVKKFASFVLKKFPESALPVIREVKDEGMQNIFIRQLHKVATKDEIHFLRMPSELFLKHITYLSKYYPREVYRFIHLHQNAETPIEQLISLCVDNNIYDACAYLFELTADSAKASDYIVKYEQVEMLMYAQKKSSIEEAEEAARFIVEFVKERDRKKAVIEETRKMSVELVNSMLAPLFYLQKEKVPGEDERVKFLGNFLRTICTSVANIVSYPALLEIFIRTFKEIDYGLARVALSSIMSDYAYDIHTTDAMCELYRQDEKNDQSNLIMNSIRGTENDNLVCCTCRKRLTGVLDQIQVFQCGHVFHRNIHCLPKQVCPVCNPEERIDQDDPQLHMLSMNIGRSQLRRFEFMLKHNSVFRQKERTENKKDTIVINPVSFVSFE